MKRKQTIQKNKSGFTLVELMVSVGILTMVFAGALLTYLKGMELSEMSRNATIAISEAKGRMEQIKSTQFDQLVNSFDNVSFAPQATITGGIGTSNVTLINGGAEAQVRVAFCWREKNGRVVGEDANLNGLLDGAEDINNNGFMDSPVLLQEIIY